MPRSLRFYDPQTGLTLLSREEVEQERDTAQQERDMAQQEREVAQQTGATISSPLEAIGD